MPNQIQVNALNRPSPDGALWRILISGAILLLALGCASTAKPSYPSVQSGEPASVLKFDNTIADSAWAAQLKAPIGFKVTIDGFAAADKDKLKSGGQIGPGKVLLPKGVTEVRLPAGSHTLVIEARLLGKGQYYFNPVNLAFDTEEARTYTLRFRQTGTIMKPAYTIEYEGWSTEQTAPWPNEVAIANPLFGR